MINPLFYPFNILLFYLLNIPLFQSFLLNLSWIELKCSIRIWSPQNFRPHYIRLATIVRVLREIVPLPYLWKKWEPRSTKKREKKQKVTKKKEGVDPREREREREHPTLFPFQSNSSNLTAKILWVFEFFTKKFDGLLTKVWVFILARPKLPLRVCRIGTKMLPWRHFILRRPLDFDL